MDITIKGITIIDNHGSDVLLLDVNVPNGDWPYKGDAILKQTVAQGSAHQYCSLYYPNVPIY